MENYQYFGLYREVWWRLTDILSNIVKSGGDFTNILGYIVKSGGDLPTFWVIL